MASGCGEMGGFYWPWLVEGVLGRGGGPRARKCGVLVGDWGAIGIIWSILAVLVKVARGNGSWFYVGSRVYF